MMQFVSLVFVRRGNPTQFHNQPSLIQRYKKLRETGNRNGSFFNSIFGSFLKSCGMLKDPMPTGANIVLENISLDGLIFKIT